MAAPNALVFTAIDAPTAQTCDLQTDAIENRTPSSPTSNPTLVTFFVAQFCCRMWVCLAGRSPA